MANSAVVKLVCLMMMCMAMMGSIPVARAAIPCGKVKSLLGPCLSYIEDGGEVVPRTCCSGAEEMNKDASEIIDRRAICQCLLSEFSRVPINANTIRNAVSLPSKCRIRISFNLHPVANCNEIN